MPRRTVPEKWPTGLIEVAPSVYGYVQGPGFGASNGGLILGDDAALAGDALFVPRMTRAYLRAIRRVTRQPVTHLVNTHHHMDHIGGNQSFPRAQIIAHHRCRQEVLRVGIPIERLERFAPALAEQMRGVRLVPPFITYDGSMTLFQGERHIELLYLGPAHTEGDTLVYLPQEKVLFAGDVAFHYVTPGPFDCHVSGWIRVADRIAGLDVETIVPGHGPVGGKRELREMRDYLALVRREARRSFRAGEPPEEAARQLRLGGYYTRWSNPERLPVLVQRLYMEFRGYL